MKNEEINFYTFDENESAQTVTFLDISIAILTMCGCLANACIVYSIVAFKNMRTIRNMIILNWCSADFLFQFLNVSKFKIFFVTFDVPPNGVLCFFKESGLVYLTTTVIFVFILNVDAIFTRINFRILKIIAVTVWVLSIITHMVWFEFCVIGWTYAPFQMVCMLFALVLLSTMPLTKLSAFFVSKFQNKETTTPVRHILTGAFCLCYFLTFLSLALHVLFQPYFPHLSALFCFSTPIVNAFLLKHYDNNFRECFLNIFCKTDVQSDINNVNDSEE